MKIFETVTPLDDPLNNFQSQFESHVRTEEFKHIKLVLTNALAKVYTRRLKAFNVHVVCHGKGLYLVKLFPTKVKRPITIKASGEFMARNNVTGEKSKKQVFQFQILKIHFKIQSTSSNWHWLDFFFQRGFFFFFSLYIEPKMNCLINSLSAYIAKHKQIFYFSLYQDLGSILSKFSPNLSLHSLSWSRYIQFHLIRVLTRWNIR